MVEVLDILGVGQRTIRICELGRMHEGVGHVGDGMVAVSHDVGVCRKAAHLRRTIKRSLAKANEWIYVGQNLG